MARFFVEELPREGSDYALTGENADHAKVLRLRPGEEVTLCDGKGMDCPCQVVDGLTLRVGSPLPCPAEPRARVTLYLAFPKAEKAEHVIQKATELGAAEIVLFPSRYCVSRPDEKSLPKKLARWERIARSAAEQSRRGVIPAVRALDSYGEAIKEAALVEVPVLFYENEEQLTLREVLSEFNAGVDTSPPQTVGASIARPQSVGASIARPQSVGASIARPLNADGSPTSDACPYMHQSTQVALMTGAEGGFSEEEILQAREAGLKICTLGPRILRCETAPLAGLTAVMYALGEI